MRQREQTRGEGSLALVNNSFNNLLKSMANGNADAASEIAKFQRTHPDIIKQNQHKFVSLATQLDNALQQDPLNPNLMYNRGFLHQNGLGCKVNVDAAITLYKSAVAQGSAHAMNELGLLYSKSGKFPQAGAFLDRAIELGNANAMFNRAHMYRTEKNEDGVVDYDKMYKLLEYAAKLGHKQANRDKEIFKKELDKAKDTDKHLEQKNSVFKYIFKHWFSQGSYNEITNELIAGGLSTNLPELAEHNEVLLKIEGDRAMEELITLSDQERLDNQGLSTIINMPDGKGGRALANIIGKNLGTNIETLPKKNWAKAVAPNICTRASEQIKSRCNIL